MAKQATFYILNSDQSQGELSIVEAVVCRWVTENWQRSKKILVACENEQQAFKLDEALWQQDPTRFVPHNLAGELAQYPTPVEICWPDNRNAHHRQVLISLLPHIPDYAQTFEQIIDFVPVEEAQKIIARERYKRYRQLGFVLHTEPFNFAQENEDA